MNPPVRSASMRASTRNPNLKRRNVVKRHASDPVLRTRTRVTSGLSSPNYDGTPKQSIGKRQSIKTPRSAPPTKGARRQSFFVSAHIPKAPDDLAAGRNSKQSQSSRRSSKLDSLLYGPTPKNPVGGKPKKKPFKVWGTPYETDQPTRRRTSFWAPMSSTSSASRHQSMRRSTDQASQQTTPRVPSKSRRVCKQRSSPTMPPCGLKTTSDMTVREIKSELESYGVNTKIFFEKLEMRDALDEARLSNERSSSSNERRTAPDGHKSNKAAATDKMDQGDQRRVNKFMKDVSKDFKRLVKRCATAA